MDMRSNSKYVTATMLFVGAVALSSCSGSDSTPAAPPSPAIGNINGTWQISETATSQDVGCTEVLAYNLIVAQNGNSATVTDADGNVFSNGVLSGNQLTWSGSYPDDIGTTTTNVTATIGANCSTLTATATWSYSDNSPFSCSGTSTATGTRTTGGSSC